MLQLKYWNVNTQTGRNRCLYRIVNSNYLHFHPPLTIYEKQSSVETPTQQLSFLCLVLPTTLLPQISEPHHGSPSSVQFSVTHYSSALSQLLSLSHRQKRHFPKTAPSLFVAASETTSTDHAFQTYQLTNGRPTWTAGIRIKGGDSSEPASRQRWHSESIRGQVNWSDQLNCGYLLFETLPISTLRLPSLVLTIRPWSKRGRARRRAQLTS
jgi:hypothetical protein